MYTFQIVKVDCESKAVISSWESEDEDYFPSEPVFIPKPDAEQEDDGKTAASALQIACCALHQNLDVWHQANFARTGRDASPYSADLGIHVSRAWVHI